MNKKKILLIPAGLLFFIMLIYTSSGYDSSRFLFFTRNVLIALFLAFLIVYAMIIIKDWLIKKFQLISHRKIFMEIIILFLGAGLMILVGRAQYLIINTYEIPQLLACDYYDEYDNLLYTSKTDHCPEILSYEYDGDLKIEFYEYSSTLMEKFYSTVIVEYEGDKMVYYEKSMLVVNNGPISLSRVTQTIEVGDHYVEITQQNFLTLDDLPTKDDYSDSIIDEPNYKLTYRAEIGSLDDSFRADLTITGNVYYPDMETEYDKTVVTGTATSFQVDYVYNSDILPIYFRQSRINVSARLLEPYNTTTFSVFGYIPGNDYNRLYTVMEYVDVVDNLHTIEDIDFATPYSIIEANQYEQNVYSGNEIRYAVEVQDFLIIERKYAEDKNSLSQDIETYFFDRMGNSGYEIDYERMLTDLSDYQYYLIRRSNPLIDYIIDMIEEETS